jgi:L-methionine (R)-S-oxide reductase
VKGLVPVLQKTAACLLPHRDALIEAWIVAVRQIAPGPQEEIRVFCARTLDGLLDRLSRGEAEAWLTEEGAAATEAARMGASFRPLTLAIRALNRCCLPYLLSSLDRDELAESLLSLDELADRRLEILLAAQEDESARRLVEAQEQAAHAQERAREVSRANAALQASERQSQHRADQIGLLASVAQRLSAVLDPEALMLTAAQTIQARMNHTYVAVVVLDEDGAPVGRWAGRTGVGRRSPGRALGPPGGVIGRAIRRKAPQVVKDVAQDPDYLADVSGTRSEMVVPLLEGGVAVGAIDFQSEAEDAFDLDDVVAGETVAEFLAVALRNARLVSKLKQGPPEARSPS